jgi:hypothetical protein
MTKYNKELHAEKMKDPEFRKRHQEHNKKYYAKKMKDSEFRKSHYECQKVYYVEKIKDKENTSRNYKKWSAKEINYLKTNKNIKTVREMSIDLNRSIMSIYGKYQQLNTYSAIYKKSHHVKKNYKKLTKDQTKYIVQNYNKIPAKDIAYKLNIKLQTIFDTVQKLRKEFPELFVKNKKIKY